MVIYFVVICSSDPSVFSIFGLILSIISSIECIVVVCGVLLILNEKYTCTGLVVRISVTSFSVIVLISLISRLS